MDLIRAAKLEKVKRRQMHVWRRKPMLWLRDRLGEDIRSYEWSRIEGYEGHEWDGDKDPLAQLFKGIGKAYDEAEKGLIPEYRYFALESATGTGKTYMLARLVCWYLDVFPNSLVITTAPSETQLKLGLWSEISMLFSKIKEIHPNARKWQLRLAMNHDASSTATNEDDAWHAKAFTTGVKADEKSSNKARGFHRKNMLIILEEATGIPLPILTAFQNTCTGSMNHIVAVGNPDNEFDTLHQFALQKDVITLRASAFDHPNVVLGKEIFEGAVSTTSIKSRTDTYGEDSQLWKAMVRGISPKSSTDALIKSEWIEQCINNKSEQTDWRHNACGVDVANSVNGDKAALAFGNGHKLLAIQEFQCENATHLTYNLLYDSVTLHNNNYHDYSTYKLIDFSVSGECVGIDAVGVGIATVNAFLDEGFNPYSLQGGQLQDAIPKDDDGKLRYRFANLRTQMYWELREDLRKGKLSIEISDQDMIQQLTKELCIPKVQIGHVIALESKEAIKKRLGGKSPNVADAIAYWNWTSKGYHLSSADLPIWGGK